VRSWAWARHCRPYRRYRELADRGEFHRVGEVLDENWIENCPGLTGWTLGLDIALANLQAGFGQAFSGPQVTELEVVEDGDALVIRGQGSAVHTGAFLGIEPTGRRVSWEYLDMYRAGADGRLNWHFLATDWNLVRLQLLGQAPDLPATPPAGPSKPNSPGIRTSRHADTRARAPSDAATSATARGRGGQAQPVGGSGGSRWPESGAGTPGRTGRPARGLTSGAARRRTG
jgi:predicted ester cyclase